MPLALSDAALARLCAGASKLPPAARAGLLQRFAAAAAAEPPRKVANRRERSRRARQRRRAKVKAYRLFLSDRAVCGLMNQLVASGCLTARTAADDASFIAALTHLLETQGAEWT